MRFLIRAAADDHPLGGPDDLGDVGDVGDETLAEAYRYPTGRRWVRANFVATVDGAATGPDDRSGSISGPADRRVLALLRALADVILVGAGTARAERYAPADIRPAFAPLRARLGLPPTPPIAVVSDSLGVPEKLLADPRTVVLTSRSSDAETRAWLAERVDVALAGTRSVEAAQVIDALTDRGYQRILCEGGPSLFGFLAAAGQVDELCLTVAPLLLGGSAPRIVDGPELAPPARSRLAGLLEDDGFLFYRWLLDRAAPA